MSSPGLRERKKAKTRRTIREQALRLFAEQGYDVTTIDQIAEAAEISPSTFFRYFATKEDVVVEDEYDPMLIERFLAQPAGMSPVAALRAAMAESLGRIYEADHEELLVRTKLQLEVPAIRARLLANQFSTSAALAEAAARRYGRDPDELAVRVFAAAVVGAMLPAIGQWVASDGRDPLPRLIDECMAHLDAGLTL